MVQGGKRAKDGRRLEIVGVGFATFVAGRLGEEAQRVDLPKSCGLIDARQNSCRISCNSRKRGDIMNDDTACTDHRILADGQAAQHGAS